MRHFPFINDFAKCSVFEKQPIDDFPAIKGDFQLPG